MSWKIVAFVFMFLFIVETLLFGYLLLKGTSIINQEKACENLCYDRDAGSWLYENGICSCYVNNELDYQGRLK